MQQKTKYSNNLPLNEFHQLRRNKTHASETPTCGELKKKVRDLERLIACGKLPEEAIAAKTKDLEQAQANLAAQQEKVKQDEKTERYFSIKYAAIKSLELKKLNRKLKQIAKKVSLGEDLEQLKEQETEVLTHIHYIKNYPKNKKYISVFGKNQNEHALQQQKELIEKTKQKSSLIESKKYRVLDEVKQQVEQNADDFFANEEMIRQKKKLVDKQGKLAQRKYKEYRDNFQVPVLQQQDPVQQPNLDAFYQLYPGLLTPNDMNQVDIMSNNPSRLQHLLHSLIQENAAIREELKTQSSDLVNFATTVTYLVEENKSLALYLDQKDIQVHQVIETATLNEAEDVVDLKHQLRLMEDENSILIKHVEELIKQNTELKDNKRSLDHQLVTAKNIQKGLEHEMGLWKLREDEMSRELINLKRSLDQEIDKSNSLNDESARRLSDLTYKDQLLESLTEQIKQIEADFQASIQDKNSRIQQYGSKIYILSAQVDDLEAQIQKQQQTVDVVTQQNNETVAHNQSLQAVCDQLAEQNDNLTESLLLEAKRNKQLTQTESALRDEINQQIMQNRELQINYQELQKDFNRKQYLHEQDISDLRSKFDTHIDKLKHDFTQGLKEKDEEIQQLINKYNREDDELTNLKIRTQELEQEISHTKSEMNDYQQQRKIIEGLQLELRKIKTLHKEDRQLLDELTQHRSSVSSDLDERDKRIMEIIQNKEQILSDQQKEIERLQEYCTFLEEHKRSNDELEQITHQHKQAKEILLQENNNYQNQVINLQSDVQRLTKELKAKKAAQDQSLIQENQVLRQQYNDLERELKKYKEIQQPGQVPKPYSETSNSRIRPPTAGSRQRQVIPQTDFVQTKPRDVYALEPPAQVYSPNLSRSPSVRYEQQEQQSLENITNLMNDSGSSIGGGEPPQDPKNIQFSFVQQQQQQQLYQYQLQQQQQQQQQQQYQARRAERQPSYASGISNQPYRY